MIGSEDERVNQDVGTPREGPRTEAGRELAAAIRDDLIDEAQGDERLADEVAGRFDARIHAIEDEARSAALNETEAAVTKVSFNVTMPHYREAVLAAIASLRDKETAK